MLERIFWAGFWFGLTLALGAVLMFAYWEVHKVGFLIVSLICFVISFLEFGSYTSFYNHLERDIDQKLAEIEEENKE